MEKAEGLKGGQCECLILACVCGDGTKDRTMHVVLSNIHSCPALVLTPANDAYFTSVLFSQVSMSGNVSTLERVFKGGSRVPFVERKGGGGSSTVNN